MGYDLHITRANFWAMNAGSWIDPAEWLIAVHEDLELQLISESETYPAMWLRDYCNSEVCFEWIEGNVFLKNPTKAAIIKMEAIAGHLQAKVQGDDGEFYRDGDVVTD